MWTQKCNLKAPGSALLIAAGMGLFAPLTTVFGQSLTAGDTEIRDAAIEDARNGNFQAALATLDLLGMTYPNNVSLLHDQITVLAWSEDDTAVITLAQLLDPTAVPRYAQLAVAKSARNMQRFDLAGIWYDAALAADRADIDALTGRVMTAADAQQPETVHALIDAAPASVAGLPAYELARGYALHTISEYLGALGVYEGVLESSPDNREALRGKVYALRAMLLPTQALEFVALHPGILSDAEIERLQADETAIQLRIGVRTPYLDQAIVQATERPLELIDAQLQSVTTEGARNALLLDRVVALADANQAAAALEAFESLPASANGDQAYVLIAAGRAYMQAEQPQASLRHLNRALELDPGNLEARFQKIYALLDLNRFDEAFALVQALNAELPMINQAPGSDVIKANHNRLRAEQMAGIAEAYGDQLEHAQARFETLLAEAPNNSDWRHELANVYRWRGWLDRSLDQYQQVLTSDEELIGARLGQAHTQIDAREFEAVDRTVEELATTHGYDMAVRRLERRWQIHNDRELTISASTGESSGPVAGTDNHAINARAYSSPIAYRYRAFVATHDSFADYPEGESQRRRVGAGIEYRSPRFTASVLVSDSRDDGESGFAGAVSYRHSDFWQLAFGVEQNTDNVQLRAHRLGIEADRGYASASYAPNELASVAFGIDHADYSDGNALQTAYVDGRRRFVNRPRWKLDGTASFGLGQADTAAVPYYSPTEDRTAQAGLEYRLRLFRRYDHELGQLIAVSAGQYEQEGFDSGSIWSIRYGIDWSISERFRLGFEAQRHGQFFDGFREHTTVGLVSFTGMF